VILDSQLLAMISQKPVPMPTTSNPHPLVHWKACHFKMA